MIYPLLPGFLVGVLGAGAFSLGVIEGVAESTAALLKVFSGLWSDRARRRRPLVLAGYGLSGTARPLIGLATGWLFVLAMRFADRVGKGLRTSPRDALIADVTHPADRGRAYGWHRAMDHAGAVTGPLVAAGLMTFAGLSLRHVFLASAAPALLVMIVLARHVREPAGPGQAPAMPPVLSAGWRELGPGYRRLLMAVFLFTLGNSTDAFLILRLVETGVGTSTVAVLWSLHHVVKMVSTWQGGRLADRSGSRALVASGWAFYAAVYMVFGLARSRSLLVGAFIAYGLYFGLTEPAEKRWVANLVPERLRGTAFGYYHGAVGLAALPASLGFGTVWYFLGAAPAFAMGALLAVSAAALLHRVPDQKDLPG
ncbi:MAG: MFS transporter [bacterium]|nr:MAG: MFS transporter [bacterium]